MKIIFLLLYFMIYLNTAIIAQINVEIEGRITDKVTSEPVPYANIYNKHLEKGTISNMDGYFRILVSSINDSVMITFIGYKDLIIPLISGKDFYKIQMEENVLTLSEVTVTPHKNYYLYSLLEKCRKNTPGNTPTSKACFELKSYREETPVELVEGYYNVKIKGYEIENLAIKSGRIALRPFNNRFFASLESSHAILMQKIIAGNEYFPMNPLELPVRKLKKHYYLDLDKKYVTNDLDSVYVIDYKPRISNGDFFEGQIWINKCKNAVIKITLYSGNSNRHPFLPLFYVHNILNVSFNITKTFQFINGEYTFNHVDFEYVIDYNGKNKAVENHTEEEEKYSIKTKAVLYAYDYDRPFELPLFNLSDKAYTDYRKISAMPYNSFFWNHNNEYKLNDSLNANELFFSESKWYTSHTSFEGNKFMSKGFFEHPFVLWSSNRIKFRENFHDTLVNALSTGFNIDKYNLAVKLYVDLNNYNDSIDISTATIFDPYDSFYKLPVDNNTLCFINLYFDLCEIERRNMEKEMNSQKHDFTKVREIYEQYLQTLEIQKNKYFKSVERGTNKEKMLVYNGYVLKHLGIDNIKIFGVFSEEEPLSVTD